jgi:hypothetical protein
MAHCLNTSQFGHKRDTAQVIILHIISPMLAKSIKKKENFDFNCAVEQFVTDLPFATSS